MRAVDFLKSHIKLIMTLLPLVIGLAMGVYDSLEYQEGLASVNWKEAQGKILSNSVRSDRVNGRMIFIPSVVYSYHVGDDAYRGTRMTYPEGMAASEINLRHLLESVAIEHPVTSYYDPKNISHVTMTRGVRHAKYAALFVRDGLIGILLPLLLFLTFRRRAAGIQNFAPDADNAKIAKKENN